MVYRALHWRSRGFTLVELLVVIGIIALLIAMLLPALNRARESARSVACLANLRQIGMAAISYANTYNYLPHGNVTNGYKNNFDSGYTAAPVTWHQFLDAHMKSELPKASQELSGIFRCPSAIIDAGMWHYSAPARVMVQMGNKDLSDRPYLFSRARRSTEVILAVDGVQQINVAETNAAYARAGERLNNQVAPASAGSPMSFYNPSRDDIRDSIFGSTHPNYEDGAGSTNGLVRWRHGNDRTANAVFFDGHAESRAIGEILNLNVRPDRDR